MIYAPIFENPKPFAELGAGAGPIEQLLFCAAPALAGYPYCAAHCRIGFVKPGPRPKPPS